MANTKGGIILLGIAPRSSQVHGLKDPNDATERIFQAALLSDPPLILPVPRLYPVQQAQVLVITVPAGLPNVYCLEGRFLGREGFQTNPLPARRLRQLLLERGQVIAEGDPLFGSTVAFVSLFTENLNDNGEVAFAYQLADGLRGVAVASPESLA